MQNQVAVLLNLSEEFEEILQKQRLDLYRVIQEELPEVHLSVISDPQSHRGEKDLITVIITTTPAIILAISPIVIRILNQFKPDTTELLTEEIETHQPDGGITIHRISVSIQRQYNQQASITPPAQKTLSESPQKSGN
jgi:hypothetical protein